MDEQIATAGAGAGQAPVAEEDLHLAANREYFNQNAHKYDDRPLAVKLAREVGEFVISKYPFDEEKTVLLDFACGTGLVSQALAPHCKKIVGVDISQGMVDWYNMRVANQGIDSQEMKAICVELKGTEDELDGIKFDIVICSMSYHHFNNIDVITKTLAYHLKPGGRLMVVDIILDPSFATFSSSSYGHAGHHHAVHSEAGNRYDGQGHRELPEQADVALGDGKNEDPDSVAMPPKNVVAHKGGFTRERIEEVFLQVGLGELEWNTVGKFEPIHGPNWVELFLATGVAP